MRDPRVLAGLVATLFVVACSEPEVPATVAANAGSAGQTAVVGAAVGTPPSVIVKSEKGTPLPGIPVTFAVASGGGVVSGATATTGADGVAAVGEWKLGNLVGANTLTATVTSLPAVTFTATGTPGPAAVAEKLNDNQSAVVGAAVGTPPGVTVKDQFGNLVAGVTVTFTITGGGGSLTGTAPATNAQGQARVGGWTLGPTVGANTMSAAVAGIAAVTFTAQATAAPASQMAKNGGDGQSAIVNRAVTTPPSVLVRDQFGNPVAAVAVTFAVASGGGSVTGAAASTNAQGIATVGGWTLGQTIGANTLTATAGTLSVQFSATGTADAAAKVTIVSGDAQADTIQATLAQPLVVQVTDQFNNLTPGATVTFTVLSGGGAVTTINAVANAQSLAQTNYVLGATAGANTVRASVAAVGSTSATFTLTAQWPPLKAVEIAVGTSHACAKRPTGQIVCWGTNGSGELGNGSTTASGFPVTVNGSANIGYDRLTAGQNYTCAIRTNTGHSYCWGNNASGQLGNGNNANTTVPVAALGGTIFVSLSTSASTTCGVRTDGTAYCWGAGTAGQLGNGASVNSATPVAVSGGLFFQQVRAGQLHVCGITTSNDGYCWGGNTSGALGSGLGASSNIAVAVTGGLKFSSLAVGSVHTCATTTTNVLYCWGSNPAGQLGVLSPASPVLAPQIGATTMLFSSVTSGGQSACGVAAVGGAGACWGSNADGQLNQAVTITPYLPSPVLPVGTVTFGRVALAPQFGCAIGSDGAVYCWGSNTGGQLGDGTTTASLVPVRVRGR